MNINLGGPVPMEAQQITQKEFKIGEKAVYPAQGVGEIVDIISKKIGGLDQKFYMVKIRENDMKVMVPVNRSKSVGLREIIQKETVEEVYTILRDRTVKVEQTTWNRRYREYMEKIKTGSVYEIAEVLRNLIVLKIQKDLSFGERKMLDTAKNLLVQEIAIAKEQTEIYTEQELSMIIDA